ncbi:hypothetical protein [Rhodopila sp.]|uniref:hypothetical protein n=1 Tax=Rhodopila sp. TaxID=2480087 RepID=UPI003D122A70
MFEMFRFYRPEVGLHRLLQDSGVADMSPRQIYHAVHNRPPDTIEAALPAANDRAIPTFIAALSSLEFQENLAAHILRSFPEKRRLYFVHIPKTAGVDLATHLICRYPSINTNLLDRTLTPEPKQIFAAMKHIVLEIACSDTIFISGHTHLGTFQKWNGNGIRYQDQVFTVVREPLEQIVSQINYTLMRIFSDENPIPPDTLGWRKLFSIESPCPQYSQDAIRQLARQILRNPGVVVPNVVCAFLGGNSYKRSVLQTVAHDLEVVELQRLDAWSEQKWSVSSTPGGRLNSSKKFVSLQDFPPDDQDYARSIVQEDVQYYEDVMAAYERHGGTSVRGHQIAN